MSRIFRLAFVGGGLNSAVGQAHYVASRMDGRFELVGGCFSRDKEINQATGEKYSCQACTFDDILYSGNVDAVAVLTPTPTHRSIVGALLERGFDVICEKSLTATVAEANELLDIENDSEGDIFVTFNYTGYPMVRELRHMVQCGALGEIISVQAEMPQEGYLREGAKPQDWRLIDGEIPAVHLDLGTHLYHMIGFITGDHAVKVMGTCRNASKFGVVDDVHSIAEFSSGFIVSMWFGKTALGYRNGLRIRINGTMGAAEWVQSNPEELQIATHKGQRWTLDRSSPECVVACQPRYQRFKAGHPAGFIEAYANLYDDFADAIERDEEITEYGSGVALEGLGVMNVIANGE